MTATLNRLQRFVKRARGQTSPAERLAGLIFERAAPELLAQFDVAALGALVFLEDTR